MYNLPCTNPHSPSSHCGSMREMEQHIDMCIRLSNILGTLILLTQLTKNDKNNKQNVSEKKKIKVMLEG